MRRLRLGLALTSACCTFSVASVPPLNPPLKGRYDEDGVFKFARVLRERRLAQQQHPQIGRNGFEPATVDHARARAACEVVKAVDAVPG